MSGSLFRAGSSLSIVHLKHDLKEKVIDPQIPDCFLAETIIWRLLTEAPKVDQVKAIAIPIDCGSKGVQSLCFIPEEEKSYVIASTTATYRLYRLTGVSVLYAYSCLNIPRSYSSCGPTYELLTGVPEL
ncbi:hypothetical protein V6N11_055078 [Hibiscus sabdariffa]|uniref:Uncharacterized protein n=1 Tax=Hibiscus sabdariffa TaxID=183260 RepID=A0ABR1ZQ87_9ROSI